MPGFIPVTFDANHTAYLFPRANAGAAINAVVAAANARWVATGIQQTVKLLAGTHSIETAIVMRSGVRLVGEGPQTRVAPTFGGAADDPTNAAIVAAGALDLVTLNTDLTAPTVIHDTVSNVTAVGTLAAGDYMVLSGRNVTTNGPGDTVPAGANVAFFEILLVSNVAALAVTHGPSLQYHAAGAPVLARGYIPVRDIALEDFFLDAAGGTLAVGALLRGCLGVKVRGVSGRGFSRAWFNVDNGTRKFSFEDLYCRGETNSILYFDSAHSGYWTGIRCDSDGTRFHANGVPRGLVSYRNCCVNIQGSFSVLERGCIGIRYWGGERLSHSNITIRDMDGAQASAAGTAAGEIAGDQFGVGIDGDAGPIAFDEYHRNCQWSNILIENLTNAAGTRLAWYAHDMIGCQMTNVEVVNRGVAGQMNGIMINTNQGCRWLNIRVTGCARGIWTLGSLQQTIVQTYVYEGTAQGGNEAIGLFLDHTGVAGADLVNRFVDVEIGGTAAFIWFGANFTDYWVELKRYRGENLGFWENCIIARNNTATAFQHGEVVTLDAASPANLRYLINPALGAGPRQVVVANGSPFDVAANTFMFVALSGRRSIRCEAGAIVVGDLIGHSFANVRQGGILAGPTGALGVALQTKAAGAGLISVGPLPTLSGAPFAASAWTIPAAGYRPGSLVLGTDQAPVVGQIYYVEIFVPTDRIFTGVGFNVGTVGGGATDSVIVALYSSAGTLLANSNLAGILVGGAAATQEVPFTAPYAVAGPTLYYLGFQFNGAICRFREASAVWSRAGAQAGVFGTMAAIVPPLIAGVFPVSYLY